MSWVRRVIITTIVIIVIIIIIITVIIVITIVVVIIREFTPTGRQEEEEGKTLVCDKAITCILCRDLHLALIFCGLFKTICLKESEVWRKVISNKIIVTFVTQGLPSSFLSRPVA